MHLDKIHDAIHGALVRHVGEIKCPGICNAELKRTFIAENQIQELAGLLEKDAPIYVSVSADIDLFIRVSRGDVLLSPTGDTFSIRVALGGDGKIRASVTSTKDWLLAWEDGIAPIKDEVLRNTRNDILRLDPSIDEGGATFRTAMVLLCSEMIGPYVELLARFTSYPRSFIEEIAARLRTAKIWDGDDVHCEAWFDEGTGGTALTLDIFLAEGTFKRWWSEDTKEYRYLAVNPQRGKTNMGNWLFRNEVNRSKRLGLADRR